MKGVETRHKCTTVTHQDDHLRLAGDARAAPSVKGTPAEAFKSVSSIYLQVPTVRPAGTATSCQGTGVLKERITPIIKASYGPSTLAIVR